MARDVIFDKEVQGIIFNNIEIFKYEYPELQKELEDYKGKPSCSCRGKIFKKFKSEIDKFNNIISKFMEEEVSVHFPGPLEETIVKEFENVTDIQKYLNGLQKTGVMVRNTSISPSKDGKQYILIAM